MLEKLGYLQNKLIDSSIIMDVYFDLKLVHFTFMNKETKLKSRVQLSFLEIDNEDLDNILYRIKHQIKDAQIRHFTKSLDTL